MGNMKRVLAMILVFALVIGCFPMMNTPIVEAADQTQKLVFDASADYSESNGNPNGQWSYKSYRTTPVFNSFGTSPTTDGTYTYWGNSSCYVDDDREGHDGYLMFRLANGTNYGAAVTFTAPYTGKISVRMKDDKITLGNANVPQGIHMWKNETTQMDLTGVLGTLSNSSYSFAEKTYEVTKGETITFACINYGGTGTSLVYMNPIISYTEVDGQQTMFDATVDYSESNGNPNGQWEYKSYRTTPVFNNFGTNPTTEGAYTYWGNSSCYVDDDREGHGGYLMFRLANGTNYGAAVTFTAPYTGKISVRMKDDKITLGNANVPQGIHMWKNETTQMDLTGVLGALSNSSYSFVEKTYEVTKGETISFACINYGGTGTSLVYMDPIITYTEIEKATELCFESGASITTSNITTQGFTMNWPEATGGTGNYSYTVYLSDNSISAIPTEGGVVASGTTHTWTGLAYGKSYYVAVVASDGNDSVLLSSTEATRIISDEYIFNAYEDFTTESNPNGQWSYEAYNTKTGVVTKLTVKGNEQWGDTVVSGNPQIYVHKLSSGTYDGKPALRMVPLDGTTAVSVSFTAPCDGTVEISMDNGVVASHTVANHPAKFLLMHNGTLLQEEILGGTATTNEVIFSKREQKVREGDVLRFVIARQVDNKGATSYITPKIMYTDLTQDNSLCFPAESEITVSDMEKDGFVMNWPEAKRGTGNYEYTVYYSQVPFESNPSEGGVSVGANTTYAFTDLTLGKEYYVAVSVNDGNETVWILKKEAIKVVSDELTYNAYDDFTTESNPNEVWSYRSYKLDTNTSKLLGVKDTDKWVNKEGNIWVSKVTNGLQMLPMDAEGSAVSFKAPYSGAVDLSMANGYIKSHSANHPATFYIIQGTRIIYKQNLGGTSDVQHEFERMNVLVEENEMIHFVVIRQKSGVSGTSYISPIVTYTSLGEDLLRFPANTEITVSKVKLDGFTVEWPAAIGGTGEYSYTVYCSEEPIYSIPKEGGIAVNGNSYSFENMTFNGQYYVAVVVDDGEHQLMMNVVEPIVVYPEMLRFNAYEDFTEKAQNSAWQYLKAPIGKSATEALTWNETQWGDKAVGSVAIVEKNPVTGYPALCVTPGTDTDVIVAFKAPYSGEIKVSMASAGIFTPLNGAGDQYDGINFTMKLNTTEKVKFDAVSAKHMHAVERDPNLYLGRLFTGSYEMSVKEGDVLYFVVNRNEALHNDQTYFNPVIEYTTVDRNTTNLKFGKGLTFTASDVTKSTLTVHWPSAFGGTGAYNYTLYVSEKPIKSIPTSGGISMGDALSYSMKNLPDYTKYYFAVVADDGENQISMIHEEGFSTIGNTYTYDAAEDYLTEMQPISTPWRYYSKDVKTGKLTELTWNKTDTLFGTQSSSRVLKVSSDLVTGRPALRLNPSQGKDAVVAFTVPFSGTVTIDMSNGGVFAPYNGEAQKWDGVSFVLKQGDKELFAKTTVSAKNNKENRCFTTGITVDVKKGEILYFIVNANANADMDSTFLAPRVKYSYVEKGSDEYGFMPGATIKATDITKNGFTLNWSKVHNPDDTEVTYKVWVATSPIKQKPSSKAVYEGTGLKAVCKGLRYATKYYAYIVATDSTGRVAILNSSDFVSTECPIYDAYKQYSDEKNEAGIWNYTIRTLDTEADEDTYVYTLLEYNEEGKRWGTSASGMVGTTESDLVTGRPAMSVHPGQKNQEAVVAFTAPYSGTVRITMNNGGVFTPHNGKDQNYDGINFTIYHNENQIYRLDKVSSENNPHAKRVGLDEIELTVAYGQKLFFVVGSNATNAADSTYFNPQIEYLEVTGGSGVIDKLEGFLLPPVIVSGLDRPVNLRHNDIFATDGTACVIERTDMMPIMVVSATGFAGTVIAALCAICKSIKKLLQRKTEL